MFNFLFALGSGLILLGIVNKRKQLPDEQPEVQVSHPAAKTFESEELMNRMEQLEQLVFQSLLRQEEAKAEEPAEQVPEKKAETTVEPAAPRKPMPDNVRAILEYENQGLSIQEIANITRMNKGEVLLLKNLSKHYSK
jgi:hypothetical protein